MGRSKKQRNNNKSKRQNNKINLFNVFFVDVGGQTLDEQKKAIVFNEI